MISIKLQPQSVPHRAKETSILKPLPEIELKVSQLRTDKSRRC